MDARLRDLNPADVKACLEAFGTERTLPAAAYTSSGVFAWEIERLWENGWVCVGRVHDFPEGSATEIRAGDESLVVTRSAGDLAVFHNVCRHRGHEILAPGERRSGGSLKCPYHGWLYRMDGSLRAAPKTSHRRDLDGVRLVGVRHEEWHGWLMVAAGEAAPPLPVYLAGLGNEVLPYRPEALVAAHRSSYEVAANWKLIHENYHECYHCASIHPQLTAVSNPESGLNRTPQGAWVGGSLELRPGVATMSMDGTSPGPIIRELPERLRDQALYVGVVPNLLIGLHPDYVVTHRLEARSPGETVVHCEWLFPTEAAERSDFDPHYAVEFWDLTNRQDWAACESLQRGAASRGYRPGMLSEGEDAVYHFIQMMAHAYSGRLPASESPGVHWRGSLVTDSTFQITVDCADPDRMARFWATALHYELQPPPEPHASWADYWRSVGLPDDELYDGYDAIIDPEGHRPRVWFQYVPEPKHVKNRLHFDLLVGGGRTVPIEMRRERVRAEAGRLIEAGATLVREMDSPDFEHFAIAMADPEGNEFDVV